jgi:protein phosphatase
MEKIALIADIHGNIPALEAVLDDIGKRGIKRIFCLGDLVGKGPHSEKSVDVCREVCEATVKGNRDIAVLNHHEHPVLKWHQQRLGAARLDYLSELPNIIEFLMSGRKIRLFHASEEGVDCRVHMWDPDERHLAMFTNTEFTGNNFTPDTVGYGDIHTVYLKNLRGKVLFNVGSVGNPLDEPTAAYAVMEGDYGSPEKSDFAIDIVRLPYDIELAIAQAKEEGMPELVPYANELRTAVYRGIPDRKLRVNDSGAVY